MVAELKIAALGGVPTQIALMLRDPAFDTTDLSSVRAVVMGGGPATPALIREARARIGAPLAVRYSCTEAGIGCGTASPIPDEDAEVSVAGPSRVCAWPSWTRRAHRWSRVRSARCASGHRR